ncbi:glycosyltransferase family 4 protein [Cytophagales bacterium LB-30]|uniref:Glycosyltransferase family 4 protein n=1 Tax=Shiella aurantiaca TaxID=3058365 RepID=A0ABT8F313_9BACT|nr:glycosyltransferase family 4 protein [Shiella aurantiaca]MDN4164749.1 glycosyltransferase family 4 protein [Shiella aurantiaca]
MKKVYFLAPYPLHHAPSQRFRFEQYLPLLQEVGIAWRFQSFLSEKGWQVLYQKEKAPAKAFHVLMGFLRRMAVLFRLSDCHYVFIHRELSPLGPPVFEWIIAKLLRKKIIYDFDDAIWMADEGDLSGLLLRLKWHKKVAQICSWSYKVSAGNAYLCKFAEQHGAKAFFMPTTLDTEKEHIPPLKTSKHHPLRIGWTGTHSTLKHLYLLWPVLEKLYVQHPFELWVIANRPPEKAFPSLRFIPWRKESEIQDLAQFDIGIMPLPDDAWSKGKCGFKALQYMALEIPAVASDVGANRTILSNGESGFLCSSEQEWLDTLGRLLTQPELRKEMGQKGREQVKRHYSIVSRTGDFLGLFA